MEIKSRDRVQVITNNGFTWVDIQQPTRRDIEMLGKAYSFHELNLEDCLSKNQLPKLDRYDDQVFIILHFPTVEKEKSIPRFSQLSIFAGLRYLVTVHQGDLRPIVEMFQHCNQNEKYRQSIMGSSSSYLLHSIIDAMVDDLLHILKKVVGNIDDIEDAVFDEKVTAAKEISLLRREITTLRRAIIPLKRIILDFSLKDVQRFSEEDLSPYFADIRDHIDKVLETLEEAKETIEIYKDTDFMLSTEKSNKILALLTIIFTLSIPASVFGSFYGMNVNLPGGTSAPWTFLGPYSTMIIVIIISIVAALVMMLYFYRLRWIGVS